MKARPSARCSLAFLQTSRASKPTSDPKPSVRDLARGYPTVRAAGGATGRVTAPRQPAPWWWAAREPSAGRLLTPRAGQVLTPPCLPLCAPLQAIATATVP